MSLSITFDRYHTNQEVRDFLQECVTEYPDLCRIECIGKSRQGRDILMMEITNRKTGPGEDKPGIYTDGNIHAGEVTGCEVALYTIKHILENYGQDSDITTLVDTRTFYFIPRIAWDGVEYYLETPYSVRSSLHPWPDPAQETDEKPGLYPEDIDGNGKILTMRVKDPDGSWTVSEKDPRLMVRRRPDDMGKPGKTYYNVYTEGLVRDYDPDLPVKRVPGKFGLDFNRQFPRNWAVRTRQSGSGEYPFSEPEMQAIGDFYLSRPNIVASMSYHTSGGIILRPLCSQRDSAMDRRDLEIYRSAGEIGLELTGYPCRSLFEGFTFNPQRPSVGSGIEWVYETLGILAFATELWDMGGRAGIPKRTPAQSMALSAKDREEDGLKMLKWNDDAMGGKLFHPWHPFEHPQLGPVEIGGWEPKMGRQNPPPELLEEECKKNAPFTLAKAAMTPRLVIEKLASQPLNEGLYKIEAVVKNEGYLPTHGTFRALQNRQVKPVKVILDAPNLTLISGKLEQEIGHLGGRAGGGDSKVKLTWVAKGDAGSCLTVTASSPKAGKAEIKGIL